MKFSNQKSAQVSYKMNYISNWYETADILFVFKIMTQYHNVGWMVLSNQWKLDQECEE